MVSIIARIRRRTRHDATKVGASHRMFTWGVLVGAVFAAVALPLLEPSVLAARNQTHYDTTADLVLTALPMETAALLSEISLQKNRHAVVAQRNETVKNGSNLMETLLRAGVPATEAHQAIIALEEVFDPRALRAGQRIRLEIDGDAEQQLLSVAIPLDAVKTVSAYRLDDEQFFSEAIEKPLSLNVVGAKGTIQDSLFQSMSAAAVPDRLIMELIRVYSWDVDFQRDIQRDDQFEIMYETLVDPDGNLIRTGNVLMAALTLSGTDLRLIRHEFADGTVDYFNEKGESVRKALLRTPIDGARLSSGYGKRRHPVLGYTRMHRGVDFSAPSGTPVMAAGDGVVEFAGPNGGYGRYLRIRHNASFKSAYAHLKGFSKNVRVGSRVKQGQIVAYVGSTGMSTGPHLHYEIHQGDKQINPLSLKLPTGRQLSGDALRTFQTQRAQLEERFATLVRPLRTAAKN
jgi:murein DD-endopeptidase MepM/ murein hydrolase activator NlpD